MASHNLSKARCNLNEGHWKSWDSGFQWNCYNPDLIQEDNNLRIIHADEQE